MHSDTENSGLELRSEQTANRVVRPAGRRRALRLPTIVILVAALAGGILVNTVTRDVTRESDRRLLDQRAREFSMMFGLLASDTSSRLAIAGAVAATTGDDPAALRRFVGPSIQAGDFLGVAILKITGEGPKATASVGDLTLTGTPAPETTARLKEAAQGGLVLVGFFGEGLMRRMGLAVGPPMAPPGEVVYAEVPLPNVPIGESSTDGTTTGLEFVVYAGSKQSDRVVFASTEDLPLRGMKSVQQIPLGAQSLRLEVAAAGNLTGGLAAALPWILLLSWILAAGAAAVVIEVVLRRRDEALRLVTDLEHKNLQLDLALAERERAEEALGASEQRFRSLVAGSPDVIMSLDVATKGLTVFNREDLFGHSRADLETTDAMGKIIHPDDIEEVRRQWERLMSEADGTVAGVECRLRRLDGEYEWVRGRMTVLERTDGRPSRILVTLTQISDERRAQAEHTRLQEELRQSQRLEAVGQLAGGVAHDFNNILAGILNYGLLVSKELGDHPCRQDVDEICRAARRAADLTRQLLVFSRREIVKPVACDVSEVVAGMERLLVRTLGEEVRLSTKLGPSLPATMVDPVELEQIVMNLAVNARDAMPDGGNLIIETAAVRLEEPYTRSHAEVTPGHYVRIMVSDTGLGMSPEIAARAFEPFFTTKGPGRGTGMGLATVYGISKRYGGHVTIYSEPAVGTTIKVYLPAETDLVAAPDHHEPSRLRAGGGETVLLVEDEESVRVTTRRILESAGYNVLEAPDGVTAARDFAFADFDMILTDVVMPGGMTGRDLARRLQARRPQLKVVYMSGYDEDVIAHRGVLEEGVVLMEKPFTEEHLLEIVGHTLGRTDGDGDGMREGHGAIHSDAAAIGGDARSNGG